MSLENHPTLRADGDLGDLDNLQTLLTARQRKAVSPAVISDAALADDALMSVDVDQVGNGSAKGLKITLIGTFDNS